MNSARGNGSKLLLDHFIDVPYCAVSYFAQLELVPKLCIFGTFFLVAF